MSPHVLLDDALGQLDEAGLARLERDVAADPALAERRDRLRAELELLLDDGELGPPPGLAERTLRAIGDHRASPRVLEFAPSASRFRWSDLAVAAAVLVAGTLALIPAVLRSRQDVAQLACMNNLRQVGLALNQYATAEESYPFVDPSSPANYVGASFVQLRDGGYLRDGSVLDCPRGGCAGGPRDFTGLDEMHERERRWPGTCRDQLRCDYSYSMGFRPAGGRPEPIPLGVGDRVPLASDQPPFIEERPELGVILDGNSPNHGGGGQNVLFSDGSVLWFRGRAVSADDRDLFLNQDGRLAPGLKPRDAVLSPAVMRFRH